MKFRLAPILYLLLAFVFIGQMTKSAFLGDFDIKGPLEVPWEEAGDEDTKTKDTDNEEDDKTFYDSEASAEASFTFQSHLTSYLLGRPEQIREIVPPPPKA
jgi:hypothetical protein